jgi:diacylglycerol kinase (ATP)
MQSKAQGAQKTRHIELIGESLSTAQRSYAPAQPLNLHHSERLMGKPGNTGLTRIIRAWGYSMQGLRAAWQHEAAFRQELMLGIFLTPAAFWLGQTPLETSLLIASLVLVLITEIINSAIEAVVDRIGNEEHELAGRAKDMGSASVWLAMALVVFVWGSLLYQRLSGI